MVVERLEITVLGGREAEFEAALLDVREGVFMSPGFRHFTVARGVDDPSTYLIQVLWESVEEHTEHVHSGRFAKSWDQIHHLLAQAPKVDRFEERPSLAYR